MIETKSICISAPIIMHFFLSYLSIRGPTKGLKKNIGTASSDIKTPTHFPFSPSCETIHHTNVIAKNLSAIATRTSPIKKLRKLGNKYNGWFLILSAMLINSPSIMTYRVNKLRLYHNVCILSKSLANKF